MARFMSFISQKTQRFELINLDLVKRIFADEEYTTTIQFTDGTTMPVLDDFPELLGVFEVEAMAQGLAAGVSIDEPQLDD